MAENRADEKVEETQKVSSYNEFIRRFYPDGEKSDKYAESLDAARFATRSQPTR